MDRPLTPDMEQELRRRCSLETQTLIAEIDRLRAALEHYTTCPDVTEKCAGVAIRAIYGSQETPMPEKQPMIVGGPMAEALAHWVQQVMAESGSPDLDVVEVDTDGKEVRRLRLKNVTLERVEVNDDPPPDTLTLTFDKAMPWKPKP